MKVNSDLYLNNLNVNIENINIIFLYGNNAGLVELLYKKTLDVLKININDPFNVSKIDGEEFKDDPSILSDNVNTLSIFSEKRHILLNLMHISITKNIEKIILDVVEKESYNYLLIIKCGNLKQSSFTKYFEYSRNSILVPCYEEKIFNIQTELSNLFSKHDFFFKEKFIMKLTQRFHSDSLTNRMEINKLENFLINNKNVTEDSILKLVSNNVDSNFNKVIECCTNGKANDALSCYQNIYENQSTSITLIRMFVNHFKLIEKILILIKTNNNLHNVIENLRPPIFFKKRDFIIFQCNLWNLKTINLILKRLIELELKCKLNNISEKTLMSQFILSTSVLAKNRTKT